MIFDIPSLTTPMLASIWTSDNGTIDHNGYVRGSRYYMSNYERGLTILDISDPTAPLEAGFFETVPAFNSTSDNVSVNVNESVVSLPTDTNSSSSGGGGSTTLLTMLSLVLALGWRRVKLPNKAH